ncbi:HCNGP-like protein [Cordyceps fumosorosea ARSEF 2679]|uniref:HCNGP-like protein n=1 Tax=Cordyceps fumosorosea (strain ARSEF 2679) TaxID=1081104 RepID=A0A168E8Q8_CORFA|nr:HCNGP-like protein [Cordyceps fumosorosea ARSEF 2679]OAA73510.1 HCNGP-like protein [Cordyceps fumosorosea ARSEF 2679]
MAGLVGYASSDEEEVDGEQPQVQPTAPSKQTQAPPPQPSQPAVTSASEPETTVSKTPPQASPPSPPAPGATLPPPPSSATAAPLGPSLQSTDPSSFAPLPEPTDLPPSSSLPPSSPYTTTRALIHDLTLPPIPNLDLPSSPPRSPSSAAAAAAATDKKCAHFLKLKRAGTHFNAKLEQSTALRNPALTDKLLRFAEVDGRGLQYQTTLTAGVWDPGAFPEWAFRDGLRRARDRVAKEREAARAAPGRTSVEFVPATTTMAAAAGAGAGAGKGEKRKGAWQ